MMPSTWTRRSVFVFPVMVIASLAIAAVRLEQITPAWWQAATLCGAVSVLLAWMLYRLLDTRMWVEALLTALVLTPLLIHGFLVDLDRALGTIAPRTGFAKTFLPYWREFLFAVLAGAIAGAIALTLRRRRAN